MVGNTPSATDAHAPGEKRIPGWHFTVYGVIMVATAFLALLIVEIVVPGTPQSWPDLSPQDLAPGDCR